MDILARNISFGVNQTKKIMAVEDELDVARLLHRVAKQVTKAHGDTCEWSHYEKADKAVETLNAGKKFDIVITDGHTNSSLGSGDGIKVLEAASSQQRHLPENLLLHTSDADLISQAKSLFPKINTLTKPTIYKQICDKLTEMLYKDK